jgi:hypothetical protein
LVAGAKASAAGIGGIVQQKEFQLVISLFSILGSY